MTLHENNEKYNSPYLTTINTLLLQISNAWSKLICQKMPNI